MFPAPPVRVRNSDLLDVLTPAYQQLAADEAEPHLVLAAAEEGGTGA